MPIDYVAIAPPELGRQLSHVDGGREIRRWIRLQAWRSEAENDCAGISRLSKLKL